MSKKRGSPEYIQQIREVLCAQAARADWPEELLWARAALRGKQAPPPPETDPEVIQALLEELAERRDVEGLSRLATLKDRLVSKAARTALHRLRTLKLDVQVPAAPATQHSGTGKDLRTSRPRSVVSAYHGRWERHVGLVEEEPKGLLLILASLSARHGLVEIDAFTRLGRKEYRGLVQRLQSMTPLVQVEHEVARWIIEDGVRRCREAGRTMPSGFARVSPLLGHAPVGDHPALSIEPGAADTHALLSLYDLPELRAWLPEIDQLRRLALRLEEIATSRLVIDEQQRRAQHTAAIGRFLVETFTPQERTASRQLLLDTAHLVSLQDRAQEAATLRAAADLFEQPPDRLFHHPFTRAFIERVLRPQDEPQDEPQEGEEEQEEVRTEAGLILPGHAGRL